MKNLNIQLQPDLAPTMEVESAVTLLLEAGRATGVVVEDSVDRGNDDGEYINLTFSTECLVVLWNAVEQVLCGDGGAAPANAAIVVCQGDEGWDDYLLLHHFNPDEPLDELVADG